MAGYVGMALSYGLSLNVYVVFFVLNWSLLETSITSVERLEQYMHIPSEAAEEIEGHQPMHNWPVVGQVKICDLKVNQRKEIAASFTLCINKFLNYGNVIIIIIWHQSGEVSAQCSASSSGDKLHF